MDHQRNAFIPTRRAVLALAAGAGWTRLYGFSSDFWNKKEPAEWSGEEIDQILTNSPWSKKVTGASQGDEHGMGGSRGGGYPDGGGMGGPRGGGMGGGGMGGRGGGMGIPGVGGGG